MTSKHRYTLIVGLVTALGLGASFVDLAAANAAPPPKNQTTNPLPQPNKLPQAPDPKFDQQPADPGYKWVKGVLHAIDTDAQGGILVITIDIGTGKSMTLQQANGCGARAADLPHVTNNLGAEIAVRIVNDCIDRYSIARLNRL